MRGRKPKPVALKILEGAQPCRINRNEPVVPAGSTEPPSWLDGKALDHWRELAPILREAGLLTSADRPALAQLCEAYRRWREDPDDSKAQDLYRRLLVEFGLTPSSRSRIKTTAEKPKDALEEFLAG